MCTVEELTTTLQAMDAGWETQAMRQCMQSVYDSHKVNAEYVSRCPVKPRRDPNGIWARVGHTSGLGMTPVYMPLHVPFVVWEASAKETGVLLQSEYVLTSVGAFEVPEWVHLSSDLGTVFDRWFQGKPAQETATLGSRGATEMAMTRAMLQKNFYLEPRHFLCCLVRRIKVVRRRVKGEVVDTNVEANPNYMWCDYVQNNELHYFEDGSESFPFHMKRWLRVERKGDPWAHFPFVMPKEHWILDAC